MLVLPYSPRRRECSHVESEQRQFALLAMPHQCCSQRENRRGAGSAFIPQPADILQVMHAVPQPDSRLQLRPDVFQVEIAHEAYASSAIFRWPSKTIDARLAWTRFVDSRRDAAGFSPLSQRKIAQEKPQGRIRETTTFSSPSRRATAAARSTETSTPTTPS